jgi:hypothetical protein
MFPVDKSDQLITGELGLKGLLDLQVLQVPIIIYSHKPNLPPVELQHYGNSRDSSTPSWSYIS